MDKRSIEQREIGQRLHSAETAIHLGRRSINELLSVIPIDEAAIEAERTGMHQARMDRNKLREDLRQAKAAEASYSMPGWY